MQFSLLILSYALALFAILYFFVIKPGQKKNAQMRMMHDSIKVGDKVRLADGDGRTHIIKEFVEEEGLHSLNFYRVIFEDNTASDHIFPGQPYRTSMIKKVGEE